MYVMETGPTLILETPRSLHSGIDFNSLLPSKISNSIQRKNLRQGVIQGDKGI